MKSWSDIRDAIIAVISIVFGLFVAVGPLLLIVWAVWAGRDVIATAIAIVYAVLLFLMFSRTLRHRMELPAPRIEREGRYPARPVDFSVFAPRHIAPGESFVLNLWVHLREQIEAVMELAQLLQPSKPVGLRAGVPVELGAEIVLRLHLSTLDVKDEFDKITWTGQPSNASFRVNVPSDATTVTHNGHFDVYAAGIRIARVLFEITLSPEELSTSQERLLSRLERLRSAFASYSSVDRVDVLGRIQGMKKIAPDLEVFLDALSLRSGDLWESRLAEEVVSKDIFYLFWSRNASGSTWVRKEWQHALATRGIDYIDPVPLETPELAPPPDELGALHFGDAFSTFAFLQKGTDRDSTGS
jgi:hypothetical protein